MTKRYGRNQKRAHRAEIAQLHELLESNARMFRKLYEEHHRLRDRVTTWVDDVRRLAGPYSGLNLDPHRVTVPSDKVEPVMRFPATPDRLDTLDLSAHRATSYEVLDALVYCLDFTPDQLTPTIRVELYTKQGTIAGYAIPQRQLMGERDIDAFAQHIARELVRIRNGGK